MFLYLLNFKYINYNELTKKWYNVLPQNSLL